MARRRRPARLLVVSLVAALGLTLTPAVAAPAEARTWGEDPLENVIHWAGQKKKCGLSTAKLAALMLAPTFPETGAPASAAPSPMTMSRWDNQRGLHSFSNSRSYRKAFWHPGIGPWQFDSAGLGAGQSAGSRIDSFTAAEMAASTIADRWCVRGAKSYVWAPWYGCGPGGATCSAIFDRIYVRGRLRGLDRDGGVGSLGGMERRRCAGPGTRGEFLCHRVDPSQAEGHRAFTAARFGPAPITAPYYVYVAGGREYRFWRRSDTGFDVGVWAKRPLGSNARSSLVWSTGQPMVDRGPWEQPSTSFTDIGPRHWAATAIEWAADSGLVTGNRDGTFRPDKPLSRLQLATILWRRAGEPEASQRHTFRKGNRTEWHHRAASWAHEQRLVRGYGNGTYRPGRPVPRKHFVRALWRQAGRPTPDGAPRFSDVVPSRRHADAVAWAAEQRYMNGFGDNTFRGKRLISRANAVRVLWRMWSTGGAG